MIPPCRACAEETRDLNSIIENVRAHESLYAEFELVWKMEFRDFRTEREPDDSERFDRYLFSNARTRTVFQTKAHFFEEQVSFETIGKKADTTKTRHAYDGSVTRILDNEIIANIQKGQVFDRRIPRSNTYFFQNWNAPLPLSAYMSTTEKADGAGTYEWKLFEPETVDDLQCDVVEVVFYVRNEPYYIARFWLAVDRNYLPVQMKYYLPKTSRRFPAATGTASDFREIGPGVWYPFRIETTSYDRDMVRAEQKPKKTMHYKWTVETAALDPDYPPEFFQMEFPDGITVYEIEGEEIIRSYLQGAPSAESIAAQNRKTPFWVWAVLSVAAIGLVVFSIVFMIRRYRSANKMAH